MSQFRHLLHCVKLPENVEFVRISDMLYRLQALAALALISISFVDRMHTCMEDDLAQLCDYELDHSMCSNVRACVRVRPELLVLLKTQVYRDLCHALFSPRMPPIRISSVSIRNLV